MSDILIVLARYEVITTGWEYIKTWIGWFAFLITNFFLREFYLQYTNFLSLTDKESVIVSAVIPAHNTEKQEEIKTVSFFTTIPC